MTKRLSVLGSKSDDREIPEHELIDRLFYFWGHSNRGALTFQEIVSGLDVVMKNGLMETLIGSSHYTTRIEMDS